MYKLIHVFRPVRLSTPRPKYLYYAYHGHTNKELCSTPTFCHVEGFKPILGAHNPLFIKNFNMKWGYLYT